MKTWIAAASLHYHRPPSLSPSPPIWCLSGGNIKDNLQLWGRTASSRDRTGKRGGRNSTMVSAGVVDTAAADDNCDSSNLIKGRGERGEGGVWWCIPSKNGTQQSNINGKGGRGIGGGAQQSSSEWERGKKDGGEDWGGCPQGQQQEWTIWWGLHGTGRKGGRLRQQEGGIIVIRAERDPTITTAEQQATRLHQKTRINLQGGSG